MWKLSVKTISFAAFFRFSHFSVAKMPFVQGAGTIVQGAKYVLFDKISRWIFFIFVYYGPYRPQYVSKYKYKSIAS